MRLGLHISTEHGFDGAARRAEELGLSALQLFARNPRSWQSQQIDPSLAEEFRRVRWEVGLGDLVTHVSYLINLASPDDRLYERSIRALENELSLADVLGAEYLVIHPGNHTGSGMEAGIPRVSQALRRVVGEGTCRAMPLIENVAGSGTEVGASPAQLQEIVEGADLRGHLGICLDTCHAFAAGLPLHEPEGLSELLDEIDATLGLEALRLIHVNDSRREFASRVDRHSHIGEGCIGLEAFRRFVNHPRLRELPMVLETPGDEDDDRMNVETMKALAS